MKLASVSRSRFSSAQLPVEPGKSDFSEGECDADRIDRLPIENAYGNFVLLGLLIYSHATGVFGSRRIEQSTYENVAVRLLTADTHPEHDTLCTLRWTRAGFSGAAMGFFPG